MGLTGSPLGFQPSDVGSIPSARSIFMLYFLSMRKLLFSITPTQCDLETFTVGGNGGSGKDTSNTGVRWRHWASGAVGECRETRSQHRNKIIAWGRMARSKKMQDWIRREAAQKQHKEYIIAEWIEEEIKNNVRVQIKDERGNWVDER